MGYWSTSTRTWFEMPTTYELLYGSEHLQWCSVCDPAKIFLTSKFSYLLFSNLTHKTETGTANRWETTIATPPGPIKLSSQSLSGVRLCCAFYQLSKLCKNPGPKPFCWAKLACMDFSSAEFNMQGHILSTSGVALTLAICEHYTLHTHP
jgi:hypothetical protein